MALQKRSRMQQKKYTQTKKISYKVTQKSMVFS